MFLVVLAIFMVAAPQPNSKAADEPEIWIKVNDVRLFTEEQPFVEDGHVYLPLRAISERVGATVKWVPPQKIVIEYKNQQIELNINDGKVMRGGKKEQLTRPPRIVNGRTFVPQQFFSDIMDFKVKWDEKIKVIEIDSGLLRIPNEPQ